MEKSEKVDSEELTTEELESEEPLKEPLKQKRIHDLDAEDELIKTLINFSKSTLKEISQVAVEKGISKGALIREAVKEYLEKLKKPSKGNPEAIISDVELTELLESCRTYWGGFKTTEEDGFFAKFDAEGWKLEDLTDKQFYDVVECLKMGYEGFVSKPSDFLDWVKELKPTKEQLKFLKLFLEYNISIDETDKTKTIAELTSEINEQIETHETE
jgi:hypothetical protein